MVDTPRDIIVRVGGAAGDGAASTGESVLRTLSRHGLTVCSYSSYQSAIRGGHNWIQIRGSEAEGYSQGDGLDVLMVFNMETIQIHAPQLNRGGGLIYNMEKIKTLDSSVRDDVRRYGLPASQMAMKYGKLPIQNTIMTGALVKILELDLNVYNGVLETTFGKKDSKVVQMNIEAAQQGYDYAAKNFEPFGRKLNYTSKQRLLMTGNQAIGLGAVAAGCKFYSAYPMTPASSILHWFAANSERYGVVVKQAEDELAVVNMAIGAGFAGVRAMCGTSGGGFSLMAEAISEAGMTETPVVIVLSQRTGPSTGLPTKTEQGDLFLALGAGQGDFPKIVMAPRTVEECFYTSAEAFNLADKYQCPVILMSDLYLSEHYESVNSLDLKVPIDRGDIADGDGKNYLRYAFTENGISPRAFPGQAGHHFVAATDEHNEKGELISDVLAGIPKYVDVRRKMMEKRMKKMEAALKVMKPPEIWGQKDASVTLVGWGSTWGPIKDAITNLARQGVTVNSVQFKYLWPFKSEESEALLESCKKLILVEGNFSGQFGRLLRMETGINIKNKLLKYDGEPIYPSEIVSKVKEVM